jgi:hypothetical protein
MLDGKFKHISSFFAIFLRLSCKYCVGKNSVDEEKTKTKTKKNVSDEKQTAVAKLSCAHLRCTKRQD